MNPRKASMNWKAVLYTLLAIDAGLLAGVCWLSLAPPVAAHAQTSSQYPELDKNGKALIDCAVAGYNHFDADIRNACAATPGDPAFDPSKFYIPQTRDAQQAIEKARQAQIAGVEAFEAYAIAKVGKDKTVSLADKEAAVAGYVAQLPALLNAVRALVGTPVPSASRKNLRNQSDALAVIAALRPSADGWKSPLSKLRHSWFPVTGSPDHGITRFLGGVTWPVVQLQQTQ
ncbi:MAG TPA: hypothetical protein VI488_19780 [Candidatus Angelobacter sp.]